MPQIHDETQPAPPVRAPINRVRSIVLASAAHFKLEPCEIYSGRRNAHPLRARHVAIYLAKKMTAFSYPAIGRAMGGRDHTTILNAVQRIEYLLTRDVDLQSDIDAVRALAIHLDSRLNEEAPIWS